MCFWYKDKKETQTFSRKAKKKKKKIGMAEQTAFGETG